MGVVELIQPEAPCAQRDSRSRLTHRRDLPFVPQSRMHLFLLTGMAWVFISVTGTMLPYDASYPAALTRQLRETALPYCDRIIVGAMGWPGRFACR